MKISVIIPFFNSHREISKVLDSILLSSVEVFEIIIVDDGSAVPLLDSGDSRIKILRNPSNRGRVHTRNFGASVAQGEILVFIDSDVLIHEDALKNSLQQISEGADGVVGLIDGRNDPTLPFLSNYKNIYMNYFLGLQSGPDSVDFVVGSFFAIRKVAYSAWPEFEHYGEDTLYGKKLHAAGKRLVLSKQVRIHHLKQHSPLSLTKNAFLMGRGWMSILFQKPKSLNSKKRLFHASFLQLISVGLAPFVAITFFSPFIGLSIFSLITLLNLKFFKHSMRRLPFPMSLSTPIILFCEYVSMSAGGLSGLLTTLNKSRPD